MSLHDALLQEHFMGERGATEARMNLAGSRAATNGVTCLQHDRLHAGLRQVEGRDQPVVSPADHDRRLHRRLSARMRIAAFRPGAPMMPPPGCVAEPHI